MLTSLRVVFLTARTLEGAKWHALGGLLHLVRTTYLTLSFPMFVSNFQEFVLSLRFAYSANRSGCFCYAGLGAVSLASGA